MLRLGNLVLWFFGYFSMYSIFRNLLDFLSKKALNLGLLILVGWISLGIISEVTHRLSPWSSEAKVKSWLLGLTPIGSSVEKVRSVVKAEHWRIFYEKGFQQTKTTQLSYPGVRGEYAIGVDFGEHFAFPSSFGVTAYWGFDHNGNMIDLRARVSPIAP